jgi:hypothetical protein
VATPQWFEEVIGSYAPDTHASELVSKLSLQQDAVPGYTLMGGLLRFKDRIYVGNSESQRLKLLAAMHSSALGGHSGIPVTYARLKQYFYWLGMLTAVTAFVQGCSDCQQAKPDRARYPGVDTQNWQRPTLARQAG